MFANRAYVFVMFPAVRAGSQTIPVFLAECECFGTFVYW